ncbi:MAG: hypothetical protein EOP18_01760 [Rhizobiaceae bacterium]|nr:MAG: hypothetical protein EOP18_01760 [Rhizobiaceae bacterium]
MELADYQASTVMPKFNHTVSSDGETMTFLAKTQSRSRTSIAAFLAMPFVFVCGIALILVLPFVLIMGGRNAAGAVGPVLMTILASGAISFVIYSIGSMPKVVPISFTKDAILWRGKRYLREHVAFGWRSSGGYVSYGGAAHNTGAALGYALSGSVYMKYGAKEITLVTGLHPDRVEAVYDDLLQSMNKMGWNFS